MESRDRIIDSKLILEGYTYLKSKIHRGKIYWDCNRLRVKECKARAITADTNPEEQLIVFKGPLQSPHSHPPNREQCEAEIIKINLKRKAEDNPGQPPAQIIRSELTSVSSGVLSQLPEREQLTKAMRRYRRAKLPPNPKSLNDFETLPASFTHTLADETFLLYDSREDEAFAECDRSRVLVFATRRNLEFLARSSTWFLDGTFKVCPTIFTQVFTILGLMTRSHTEVALPFVYALLSSKESREYAAVLRAIQSASEKFQIPNLSPQRIVTDFEKSIIIACEEIHPTVPISCCFFHLGQSMYRKIQSEGLQEAYNDALDRELKTYAHMLLALAYVPVENLPNIFRKLEDEIPEDLLPIYDYFKEFYVIGRPGRGRRKAVAPRFPPKLWNQYDAALTGAHKTNNVSEGWHNRFRLVVGKHHPDLYSALREFQKEQADVEIMISELSLGRSIKAAPKKKWLSVQQRIQNIVEEYKDYKNTDTVLDFLRCIAHTIVLS